MKATPFLLHALSPLHVGTGHAADIIDLPIARQRATGLPYVPGSAIKGVLREARTDELDPEALFTVFGPDARNAGDNAGALVVGDARLLALPVRSFRGTFAWVTSPLLLRLARRDLGEAAPAVPEPAAGGGALVGTAAIVAQRIDEQQKLFLEDLDLDVAPSEIVDDWADYLAPYVWPDEPEVFQGRLAVVDDETMTFLWETATQLDTRVRLSSESRTVDPGALWVEESLPPETVLLGVLAADRGRRNGGSMKPEEVLGHALPDDAILQLGGKATIGRGRCRMVLVEG